MKAQPQWNGGYIERLPKQPLSSRIILALLLLALATSAAQMKPGDRRKAYAEVRASVIESLLASILALTSSGTLRLCCEYWATLRAWWKCPFT